MFKQPISLAFAFIIDTKLDIVDPVASAKTFAASFPEFRRRQYSNSFTVIISPVFKYTTELPTGVEYIAFLDAIIEVDGSRFSKTSIAVKIFVVLAGYIFENISFL
ncbi:hypothetical protein D3C76_1527270 [compost metagenome]